MKLRIFGDTYLTPDLEFKQNGMDGLRYVELLNSRYRKNSSSVFRFDEVLLPDPILLGLILRARVVS